MNDLIKIGKKRTILISIAILLVSLLSVYIYSIGTNGIETGRLIKQLIRFALTIILLIMIYKGKYWAKVIAIILFSLVIIGILLALDASILPVSTGNLIFYWGAILVYTVAIYHFGFSKSFKAFFKYLNNDLHEL